MSINTEDPPIVVEIDQFSLTFIFCLSELFAFGMVIVIDPSLSVSSRIVKRPSDQPDDSEVV